MEFYQGQKILVWSLVTRPPHICRHSDDYEELDLTEFDEETVMDGYEEVIISYNLNQNRSLDIVETLIHP